MIQASAPHARPAIGSCTFPVGGARVRIAAAGLPRSSSLAVRSRPPTLVRLSSLTIPTAPALPLRTSAQLRQQSMLSEWTLSNFKSYRSRQKLNFNRLTFLCGPNSSGKSSIIQSILLVKQTLQHSLATRPIALNGPLVRLGTFSDILSYTTGENASMQPIEIGWRLDSFVPSASRPAFTSRYGGGIDLVDIHFAFDTKGAGSDAQTLEIQPTLTKSEMHAVFRDYENSDRELNIEIQRSSKRGRRPKFASSTLDDTTNPFEFLVLDIDKETKGRAVQSKADGRLLGCVPRHFIPEGLVVRFDRSKQLARIIHQGFVLGGFV